MCKPFFARRFDGECAAVDGLLQSWSTLPRCAPQQPAAPHKPLCWVFPPTALLTAALGKLARERPEAWLVCPRNLRPAPAHTAGLACRAGGRVQAEVQLTAAHSAMVRDDAKRVGEGASRGVEDSAAGGAGRGGCGAQTAPVPEPRPPRPARAKAQAGEEVTRAAPAAREVGRECGAPIN